MFKCITHTYRDPSFEVSKVTSHDVIHAGSKLITSIFKISCNQQGCVGLTSEVLILTENEAEKDRWITTLKELQKATKQSPNQMVLNLKPSLHLLSEVVVLPTNGFVYVGK